MNITGTTGNDILNGTSGADYISGGDGNDKLYGGAGEDVLDGGTGDDTLDGGIGADTLVGGEGNDTYIVENVGDLVIEEAIAGIDLVKASISYTLTANVENLTQMGAASINGFGNAIANGIKGNSGDNALWGMGGNDQIDGGLGADLLAGGSGSDYLRGGTGADTFYFAVGDISAASGIDQIADLNFAEGDRISLDGYREGPARIIASYADLVSLTDHDPTVTVSKHSAEGGTADIKIAGPGGRVQTIWLTDASSNSWALFSAAAVRPVATADNVTTTEKASLAIDVLANDTGPDLSITAAYGPVHSGQVSITAGKVVFNPLGDFAYLAAGESTVVDLTYTISTAAGRTATSQVHVTVTGLNDVAEISGQYTGDVFEDGVNAASGKLIVTDADHDQDAMAAGVFNGEFGTLTLAENGAWTYTLNEGAERLKALNGGESAAEHIHVQSADGTTHTVEITVHGSDENPSQPVVYTGGDDPNDMDGVTGGGLLYTAVSAAALRGSNILYGTGGADTIDAGVGNDTIYGWGGDDFIIGGQGLDKAYGGSGNDTIQGNQATDILYGGSGSDAISGIQGDDVIIGGFGADTLTGNDGFDQFVFLDVRDTNDTISDLRTGDVIDLTDFKVGGAQYDFKSIAESRGFSASHDLIYHFDGVNTILLGNTDGDFTNAEFKITIRGNVVLDGTNVII